MNGACSYLSSHLTCAFGCSNGACATDSCANVTCNAPPAPSCSSGVAHSSGAGQCVNGACQYAESTEVCPSGCAGSGCAAVACGSGTCSHPPASTCLDASTAVTYAPLGTCSSTTCSYQATKIVCSAGCLSGACIPGGEEAELIPLQQAVEPRLAIDGAGHPHLAGCAYNQTDSVIYQHRDASGWSEVTVDTGLGGCHAELALDLQGRPLVAYEDFIHGAVRFATNASGTFVPGVVASGSAPSITVSPAGAAVVAFLDASSPKHLKVATKTSSGWTLETVTTWNDAAQTPTTVVGFDPAGDLHVLVGDSSVQTRSMAGSTFALHAVKHAGSWRADRLGDFTAIARRGLAFDRGGRAQILVDYLGSASYTTYEDRVRYQAGTGWYEESAFLVSGAVSGTFAIGLTDVDTAPRIINGWGVQRQPDGLWGNGPGLPAGNAQIETGQVLDFAPAPDGMTRYVVDVTDPSNSSISGQAIAQLPACVPDCSTRSCGDDGCGGSCGTCGSGQLCEPDGTCGGWAIEQVQLEPGAIGGGISLSYVLDPRGSEGIGYAYDYPLNDGGLGDLYYQDSQSGRFDPVGQPVLTSGYGTTTLFGAHGLAFDDGGAPELAWLGYQYAQTLAHRGSAGWSTVTWPGFPSASSGLPPAMALDASGAPALLFDAYGDLWYRDASMTDGGPYELASAPYDYNYGYATESAYTLAYAPDGSEHALWVEGYDTYNANARLLEAHRPPGGGWVTSTVENPFSGGYAVSAPSMAIDANGAVHLLYGGSSGSIIHAVSSGSGWAKDTLPVTATDFTLALDPQGQPVVAVAITSQPGSQLLLLRKGGSGWTQEKLPIDANVGSRLGLQVDPGGHLHLLFEVNSTVPVVMHARR